MDISLWEIDMVGNLKTAIGLSLTKFSVRLLFRLYYRMLSTDLKMNLHTFCILLKQYRGCYRGPFHVCQGHQHQNMPLTSGTPIHWTECRPSICLQKHEQTLSWQLKSKNGGHKYFNQPHEQPSCDMLELPTQKPKLIGSAPTMQSGSQARRHFHSVLDDFTSFLSCFVVLVALIWSIR